MGIFDGILGAGVSALGGFLGQQQANSASSDAAAQQMQFQQSMSNTSYQRAVKDMEAAGLNPMLAYSQGGASAPIGAMPSTFGNKWQAGINSAVDSQKWRLGHQEEKIKKPLENASEAIAPKVEAGFKTISDTVSTLAESVSNAVMHIEDAVKGGSVSSALSSTAIVDKAADLARRAGAVIPGAGAAQKIIQRGTSSAADAVERAKAIIADPSSASSMPSAREQAARSGRRLGTLGRSRSGPVRMRWNESTGSHDLYQD